MAIGTPVRAARCPDLSVPITNGRQLSRAGAQVLTILSVIDREQGGAENIAAAGYRYHPLFSKKDLDL